MLIYPSIAAITFFMVAVLWPYALREAEKKNEDIYEKLPLFQIEQTYGGTEGVSPIDWCGFLCTIMMQPGVDWVVNVTLPTAIP